MGFQEEPDDTVTWTVTLKVALGIAYLLSSSGCEYFYSWNCLIWDSLIKQQIRVCFQLGCAWCFQCNYNSEIWNECQAAKGLLHIHRLPACSLICVPKQGPQPCLPRSDRRKAAVWLLSAGQIGQYAIVGPLLPKNVCELHCMIVRLYVQHLQVDVMISFKFLLHSGIWKPIVYDITFVIVSKRTFVPIVKIYSGCYLFIFWNRVSM